MIELRVDEDHGGVRLDKLLRERFPTVPVSHLFKMVRTKKIRVNGRRAQPDQPLAVGDLLLIRGTPENLLPSKTPGERAPARKPPLRKIPILFEDGWMMAVDKPSGMAVHPGSGITSGTLVDWVRDYLGPTAVRNGFAASPAHRLDRDTSGVIIIAKRRPAMVHFTKVFTEGRAKKRYFAWVKGKMPKPSGEIDLPLAEHQQTAASRARRGVNYQAALTRWKVLAKSSETTLLECRIATGRTHQIRRHLAAVGHPVLGDRRHGDFAYNRQVRARWGLERLFLHAERIELPHPETSAMMRFRAPVPDELLGALSRAGIELHG